jgi:hypothetical protein
LYDGQEKSRTKEAVRFVVQLLANRLSTTLLNRRNGRLLMIVAVTPSPQAAHIWGRQHTRQCAAKSQRDDPSPTEAPVHPKTFRSVNAIHREQDTRLQVLRAQREILELGRPLLFLHMPIALGLGSSASIPSDELV